MIVYCKYYKDMNNHFRKTTLNKDQNNNSLESSENCFQFYTVFKRFFNYKLDSYYSIIYINSVEYFFYPGI